jgi:hypothetical protein
MKSPRVLEAAFHKAWPQLVHLSPRAKNPYGSHIPILMICCAVFRPERILELGTGSYSTALFLNPSVCPSLKLLHSIEDDPAWLEQVRSANIPDERWKLELRQGSVSTTISRMDTSQYDLIFIDDSKSPIGRSQTVQAVYAGRPRCPVIIHDAELWRIRTRIWLRTPFVVFDAFNPQTAVCLPRHSGQLRILRDSRNTLRSLANTGQTAGSLEDWQTAGRSVVLGLHLRGGESIGRQERG